MDGLIDLRYVTDFATISVVRLPLLFAAIDGTLAVLIYKTSFFLISFFLLFKAIKEKQNAYHSPVLIPMNWS